MPGSALSCRSSVVVVLLGGQALGTSFVAILRTLSKTTFPGDIRGPHGSNALLNAQIHLELGKIWASEGPVLYGSGAGVCTLGTGGRMGRLGEMGQMAGRALY